MLKKSLMASLFFFVSSNGFSFSSPVPRLDEVSTKGTCNDVEVFYDQEKNQLEYEFLDYEAFTDVNAGVNRVRARCTVEVPVEVPFGYQIAVAAAILEYSGYVAPGGQGYTSIRYRFSGQSSEGITKTFPQGPLSYDDSRIIYAPKPDQLRFSDCSNRKPVLELVSAMTVRAPTDGFEDTDVSFEQGFSTFKDKYFTNNAFDFVHKLKLRKCL